MKERADGTPPRLPSRQDLLDFIHAQSQPISKRDIARHFGLSEEEKTELRDLLKEFETEGLIDRQRGRRYAGTATLPSVAVVEITGVDTDGEMKARPADWKSGSPPVIYIAPEKKSRSALARGDRALARLKLIGANSYEGRVIRRLTAAPARQLAIIQQVGDHKRALPISRRTRGELLIAPDADLGAEPGELVWLEVRKGRPLGPSMARVVERLGPTAGPRSITPITIHDHEIPELFSAEALRLAAAAGPAPLADRVDVRDVPLVTIDGEDARDFDDAVWAEADPAPDNTGGWRILVAIADVGWYVRPGDALDRVAFERGNSVYFPDRVVPMLPFELSNEWCSLKPNEDRPCVVARLTIDRAGCLVRHRFERAMMRSAARLTYRQVQAARAGQADAVPANLTEKVIGSLFGAYEALAKARAARGVLELDVPERKIVVDATGTITSAELREQLESHKLIEEFMILANVAAAETLEGRRAPCVYRVHDRPDREKIASLREFLATLDFGLPAGNALRPRDFNRILLKVADRPEARLINEVILRSQAQAEYNPKNIGHFGLSLKRYCHFTSPIRRYADLLVHRALIDALSLGEGGVEYEPSELERVAEHISVTERRAAAAERDAVDRFMAAFLAEKVGGTFRGRINGVTRFGVFVTLDDNGADGLVPISTLPGDYYHHDERGHRLVGRAHGLEFRLGDRCEVKLTEANPISGGLVFEIVTGIPEPGRRRSRPLAPPARPHGRRRR